MGFATGLVLDRNELSEATSDLVGGPHTASQDSRTNSVDERPERRTALQDGGAHGLQPSSDAILPSQRRARSILACRSGRCCSTGMDQPCAEGRRPPTYCRGSGRQVSLAPQKTPASHHACVLCVNLLCLPSPEVMVRLFLMSSPTRPFRRAPADWVPSHLLPAQGGAGSSCNSSII